MRMKRDKNFKDFDRKSAKRGFDRRMYERMKRRASKIREEIDPEFEEELKKYDFDKMFRQFNQRPMRSHPEELRVMEPIIFRKMSRRDIARMKFVTKRRQRDKINSSFKLKFQEQRLKLLDVQEHGGMEQKSYKQLVEEINQNYKRLENVDKPLQVYKDDKEVVQQIIKKQDETISRARKIIYPIFGIAFLINSLILIGIYYQKKEGDKFERSQALNLMGLTSQDKHSHIPESVFESNNYK